MHGQQNIKKRAMYITDLNIALCQFSSLTVPVIRQIKPPGSICYLMLVVCEPRRRDAD